jgi:hypothetical protein
VECSRDEDDTSSGRGIRSCIRILGCRFDKVGESSFEGVEGAESIDLEDCSEGIG